MIKSESYFQLKKELGERNAVLVAVSKTKPVDEIKELYDLGQRDFGENYVQELLEKAKQLPPDISWHFIGHLQTNKVKQIIGVVQLIQGIDSLKLLKEVNKQGTNQGKIIDCLLQVHIAEEETKFGLSANELTGIINGPELNTMNNVRVRGLMGMASFTEDKELVKKEFAGLKKLFDRCKESTSLGSFNILSMGMSSDYVIAIEEGANLVRIGSLLFGERNR